MVFLEVGFQAGIFHTMLKNKIILHFFLVFILILNTSCIHVKTGEDVKVQLDQSKDLNFKQTENYEIRSFVYSQDKYPLEDFLVRFKNGDFTDSLKSINLNYSPANTNNKIFKKLIGRGYVPVYVSYQNKAQQDIKINFKQFQLSDGQAALTPLNPVDLPKKIKQFHAPSLAANTYNITVTVTGVVLLALLISALQAPNMTLQGLDFEQSDNQVLNPLDYTTRIDYQNFLLTEKTLKPNESFTGLLFFYNKKSKNLDKHSLQFANLL